MFTYVLKVTQFKHSNFIAMAAYTEQEKMLKSSVVQSLMQRYAADVKQQTMSSVRYFKFFVSFYWDNMVVTELIGW